MSALLAVTWLLACSGSGGPGGSAGPGSGASGSPVDGASPDGASTGGASPDGALADDDFGPAPTFSLVDQNGVARTQADFAGKVWVADFIFTSCTSICPTLTAKMADLGKRHPDLRLVSFSVDPKTDTPPVLLAYAAHFQAGPEWTFLTGPTEDVRKVVVDGFKQAMETTQEVPGGPESVLHGDRFVVVDAAGRMRGFPEADDPALETLLARLAPPR